MRFAISVDADGIEAWQSDGVQRLIDEGLAVLGALLVADTSARSLPRALDVPCRKRRNASDRFPGITIVPLSSADGAPVANLDFVLDFRGPDASGFLPAARFGAWRFRFGDPGLNPGSPPCFWEMSARDPVVSAALVRVVDRSQAIVLKRGRLPVVRHSYQRSVTTLTSELSRWPSYVCRDLLNGIATYVDGPAHAVTPEAESLPNGLATVKFLATLALNRLSRALKLLFIEERWNIGIADAPIAAFLGNASIERARWFPQSGRYRFLADPFGRVADGRTVVLCEWYDSDVARGKILQINVEGDAWQTPRVVVDLPFHVSYPYIVNDAGRTFCVLETGQAHEIVFYDTDPSTGTWRKAATLLGDVAGVDTSIVRRDGRWWLFTGLMDDGPMYKLHVWYADELFGPWRPHPANPVKMDIGSARGAGTPFEHEGVLYRPAQDCSESYGRAVIINRVLELTPTTYREEYAATVLPPQRGPYPLGVHTLSSLGNRTLVDGKYRRITGRGLRYQLSRPFRLMGKIARRFLRVAPARPAG